MSNLSSLTQESNFGNKIGNPIEIFLSGGYQYSVNNDAAQSTQNGVK